MPQMQGKALEISLDFQFGPIPAIFSAHASVRVFHSSLNHLLYVIQQISSWVTANLLTLSSSTTEFLFIGLKQKLAKIHKSSLPVFECNVCITSYCIVWNNVVLTQQSWEKAQLTMQLNVPYSVHQLQHRKTRRKHCWFPYEQITSTSIQYGMLHKWPASLTVTVKCLETKLEKSWRPGAAQTSTECCHLANNWLHAMCYIRNLKKKLMGQDRNQDRHQSIIKCPSATPNPMKVLSKFVHNFLGNLWDKQADKQTKVHT